MKSSQFDRLTKELVDIAQQIHDLGRSEGVTDLIRVASAATPLSRRKPASLRASAPNKAAPKPASGRPPYRSGSKTDYLHRLIIAKPGLTRRDLTNIMDKYFKQDCDNVTRTALQRLRGRWKLVEMRDGNRYYPAKKAA